MAKATASDRIAKLAKQRESLKKTDRGFQAKNKSI